MTEAEEYFNSVERNSWHWLNTSESLKYSSEVIYQVLLSMIDNFHKDRKYEGGENMEALWASYYLLVGHSFENLVKGLSIENNRSAESFKDIFKKWGDKGHKISQIAKDNIPLLTKKEIWIIEKLETYIVWAGRFVLPRTPQKYKDERERLFYYTGDYDIINILYDRTREILKQAREKNESKIKSPAD